VIVITVILLVAFILTLKLQHLYFAKIAIYVIALAWVLWVLFAAKGLV
jgi:hypothetical protein